MDYDNECGEFLVWNSEDVATCLDWEVTSCQHESGWVTAYISPYQTTLECPECGDQQRVYDH